VAVIFANGSPHLRRTVHFQERAMIRNGLMLFIVLMLSCQPSAKRNHVVDAGTFTSRYANSRLSKWNVRASAAGADCGVLIIDTSIILEDSMVEALHYGAGPYGVLEGGIQRFCTDRSFRAVAYRDSSGRIWTYGDVSAAEVKRLKRCG
jgi:hypothetical protein